MSAPPNPPSRRRALARTPFRRPRVAVFAFAATLAGILFVHADSTPDYGLVVLAEPQDSADLATGSDPQDVTLSYHVAEIFRGDPGAESIVVRHGRLALEQRQLLASSRRVIVLANPKSGGFEGPAPLRATPEAVAAFRSWSAPSDVRPERDVSEVIAEVATDVVVAPRGERPPPVDAPPIFEEIPEDEPAAEPTEAAPEAAPEAPPGDSPVVVAEVSVAPAPSAAPPIEEVTSREADLPAVQPVVWAATPPVAEPIVQAATPPVAASVNLLSAAPVEEPVVVSEPVGLPVPTHPAEVALARLRARTPEREQPSPLAESGTPAWPTAVAAAAPSSVPVPEPSRVQPVLVPRVGPGLPPAPDPTRVLGPPLEERKDLREPRP